jgi:pyruvate/2-oxoglutarate dehydrogenase complex dihydrolipoamide acyltransferase (E2) component
MASIEVRLPPDLGDGKLIEWIKHPGERVEIDDVLFELETDKTTVQCIAPQQEYFRKYSRVKVIV